MTNRIPMNVCLPQFSILVVPPTASAEETQAEGIRAYDVKLVQAIAINESEDNEVRSSLSSLRFKLRCNCSQNVCIVYSSML